MALLSYKGSKPQIGKNCFIAENATICGNVSIGDGSSVWFGTSIRAEQEFVKMGSKSNIQDNCVVHTDGGFPCIIGDGVSIGHGVIIHGSMVDSNCLIGMGAILMNGSKLGMDCIVGAGSLVLQDVIIPERSLVVGSPASVKRKLTGAEIDKIRENAKHYCEFTMSYLREKYS